TRLGRVPWFRLQCPMHLTFRRGASSIPTALPPGRLRHSISQLMGPDGVTITMAPSGGLWLLNRVAASTLGYGTQRIFIRHTPALHGPRILRPIASPLARTTNAMSTATRIISQGEIT